MRRSATTAALLAIAVVAVPAGTSTAKPAKGAKAQAPQITRVTPMRIEVGGTLTVRGKRFKAKPKANTIIFRAPNGRTAFVKPRRASRTKLVLRVSPAVARLLTIRDSRQRPTRLKLRVLAGKFSRFTSRRLSPVVLGVGGRTGGPGGGTTPKPLVVCNNGADHDKDLLPNSLELQIGTDPCLKDTDGDGLSDGWEYYSAKDLNLKAVPYPGKRPFPNALDPTDADYDFDGDGLTAKTEYRLWVYAGSSFEPSRLGPTPGSVLGYSDGTQASRPEEAPAVPNFRSPSYGLPFSPPAYPARHVMPHPGPYHAATWTDDERDADRDGLNNFVEAVGPGLESWWPAWFAKSSIEPWPDVYYGAFDRRPFASLDPADPDVDGDTLLDGEDDQDSDGVLNFDEMYDPADLYPPTSLRKNAFNPCAPDPEAPTCPLYQPM